MPSDASSRLGSTSLQGGAAGGHEATNALPAPAPSVATADKMERLNSFEDFKMMRDGRRGPPSASRFWAEEKARRTSDGGGGGNRPLTVGQSARPWPWALSATPGPSTPPQSMEKRLDGSVASNSSGSTPRRPRSVSDDGCFASSSSKLRDTTKSPAEARRRRRATDSGTVASLAVIIEKRNLRHLETDEQVAPTVWPSPPSIGAAIRRHTTDGITEHRRPMLPGFAAVDSNRRHTISNDTIPEERPMSFDENGRTSNHRLEYVESCVYALSSKLADAVAHAADLEQRLAKVADIQLWRSSGPAVNVGDAEAAMLKGEVERLKRANRDLMADVRRKEKLLERASVAFPMLENHRETELELGPLHEVLSGAQTQALLELLATGAKPKDVHRLLLGISQTGADLTPFANMAGVMHQSFEAAENSEHDVKPINTESFEDSMHSLRPLLTRDSMAQLIRDKDINQLRCCGVPHALLAEISLASLSGLDPWSIVNLLDGRLSRESSLDITLAPSLFGTLSTKGDIKYGMESEVCSVLSNLAKRCSMSSVTNVLAQKSDLEEANANLTKHIEELEHTLEVRHCKWADASRHLDIVRLDSFGSSLGSPYNNTPATGFSKASDNAANS